MPDENKKIEEEGSIPEIAGVIITAIDNDQNLRFLMIRRSQTDADFPNKLSILTETRNQDNSLSQTILRGINEELVMQSNISIKPLFPNPIEINLSEERSYKYQLFHAQMQIDVTDDEFEISDGQRAIWMKYVTLAELVNTHNPDIITGFDKTFPFISSIQQQFLEN